MRFFQPLPTINSGSFATTVWIGYMLSYNFNRKKKIGVKELHIGDRILVEAVV